MNGKDQMLMGLRILPEDYLCPMKYYTGKKKITKNTYSIHHYCASWTSVVTKRTTRIKRIIGVKMYDKLYGKFLHKFFWLALSFVLIFAIAFLSMPLVLGSVYSFLVFLAYPFIIVKRIKSEEEFLQKELDGYREYKSKVKYRLIPFIW